MRDYAELITDLRACAYYGEHAVHRPEIERRAANAIEELLAAVPHWISVEDRLPEELTWVLVCCEVGMDVQFIKSDGTWYGSWNGSGIKPLYWMPLPTPPVEG